MRTRKVLAHRRAEAGGLNAYLDSLFGDVLRRCERDAGEAAGSQAYGRLAMQSLVLARLAGFLAGHVALNEDPMRKLIEAVMLGYGEAEAPVGGEDHLHGHDHDHGHYPGHVHEH